MKFHRYLMATLLIVALGRSTDVRADLHWDTNGSAAGGSNSDTAPGTWGTDAFWSADPNGLAATTAWTLDETAVFSADTNVTGEYSVSVNGSQSAGGIKFEEGTVTLTGGTVNLTGTATVTVTSPTTQTINSAIGGAAGLTLTGSTSLVPTLVLGGANTYSGDTILTTNPTAGTFNWLRLGASNVIPNTSIVQVVANSNFDLNGNTETVRSISGGGANTRVDVGTGALTIADQTGDVITYSSQLITSGAGKVFKTGDGQFNVNVQGNSGFDGEFVLNSGTLGFGFNNSLSVAASTTSRLTLNGGTVTPSGNIATARSIQTQNVDIANSFTASLNAGNFQFIGTGIASGDDGTVVITLKVDNPTITVNNAPTTSGTFILCGPVGDEGQNRGFTKAGSGVLTLNSSTNTFGGDMTITGGQLRIDGNATVGDGTGTVRLVGAGTGFVTTQGRDPVLFPINNPIEVSADSEISTTRAQVEPNVVANFTSNSITGTAGTLTIRNNAAAGGAQTANVFDPRFAGNFNFSRPVVIAAGLNAATRTTRLSSANASGQQTWSGDISGPGKFRRMVDGGTTVLTGANTFSGGAEVEGGTLTVDGSTATVGTGNVTVTGGILDINTGVANAMADTATLSISGTGIVNLDGGINDTIAGLILGGTAQTTPGTYGSTASGAAFPNDTFFTGMGRVTLAAMAIAGDFDGDGDVDSTDFNHATLGFKARFGNDLDGGDFLDWQRNFGTNVPPSAPSAAAVPEPASGVLVTLAVAGAFAVRRRARRDV